MLMRSSELLRLRLLRLRGKSGRSIPFVVRSSSDGGDGVLSSADKIFCLGLFVSECAASTGLSQISKKAAEVDP